MFRCLTASLASTREMTLPRHDNLKYLQILSHVSYGNPTAPGGEALAGRGTSSLDAHRGRGYWRLGGKAPRSRGAQVGGPEMLHFWTSLSQAWSEGASPSLSSAFPWSRSLLSTR